MLRIAVFLEWLEAERHAEDVEQFRTAHRRAATPHERHLGCFGVDGHRIEYERHLLERRFGIDESAASGRREWRVVGQPQDEHARPLSWQRRPPLGMLRVQVQKFHRFVAAEIALHPLIGERRHPEPLVELWRRPRPPRAHARLAWDAGMLAPLRPVGRDRAKPGRIACRAAARDRPGRDFEVGHPLAIDAEPERIRGDAGTAERAGEREGHPNGDRRPPGKIVEAARVPLAVPVHSDLFPPAANGYPHGKLVQAQPCRRTGRADHDHLARRLPRHEVGRIPQAVCRVVVRRVAGGHDVLGRRQRWRRERADRHHGPDEERHAKSGDGLTRRATMNTPSQAMPGRLLGADLHGTCPVLA